MGQGLGLKDASCMTHVASSRIVPEEVSVPPNFEITLDRTALRVHADQRIELQLGVTGQRSAVSAARHGVAQVR